MWDGGGGRDGAPRLVRVGFGGCWGLEWVDGLSGSIGLVFVLMGRRGRLRGSMGLIGRLVRMEGLGLTVLDQTEGEGFSDGGSNGGGSPLLRLRLQLYHYRLSPSFISPPRWHLLSTAAIDSTRPEEKASSSTANSGSLHSVKDSPKYQRWNDADYRQWKNKEDEILKDISPIILLTKDILHSGMYMDGERLTPEDEKAVVERLLAYHPHAEDKIGCGLDSIMVFECVYDISLGYHSEEMEMAIREHNCTFARLASFREGVSETHTVLSDRSSSCSSVLEWESSPEKKKEETWLLVGSPRQRDVMETLSLIESPEKNDKEPLAHFTICNQEKGLHLRNMCFGPNLKRQRMTLRCLFPRTKKRPKVDRVVVEPSNMPVVVVALSTSWDLGKLS
uniref:Protein DCL, chloroplastic n=1 Tax=Cannabis sativa TaxID=3483 RepID=A0A803NI55_CANSA